jgi:uncharacterized membrane protein
MNALTVTTDPAWPFSYPDWGTLALFLAVLLIVGLTVWAYLGAAGATPRRILAVLALRLAVVLLAFLAVLRPALAFRDDFRVPSVLILACDDSESMTIQDEFDGQSRWDYLRRSLDRAEPVLRRLREERNVNVVFQRFGADLRDFDPADDTLSADGPRSDYGHMMHALYERHRGERSLRALLVLGDGTDNGTRHQALPLAAQWRNLPCPVHTFGYGKPTTTDRQTDVTFTNITVEPSPTVPVKGKMTIRATVDAPGFEGRTVKVRTLIDGAEVPLLVEDREQPFAEEPLRLTGGNEVKVVVNAPAKPGEVKVTLKIEPFRDELATFNNEISTFATVSKEGISVLLVDKARHPEPVYVSRALRGDPRFRLYDVAFRNARETPDAGVDLYRFNERFYDVIIVGDVTPGQFAAGAPRAFETVEELVRAKGTGLLLMGGYNAFGPAWRDTPLAGAMPVDMDGTGQVDGPVKMRLTEAGKSHFVLRLDPEPAANDRLWGDLASLNGMSRIGKEKPGVVAAVLAESDAKEPVLAARTYGSGRTVAFGGDSTYRWVRPPAGHVSHARFWRQLVLWLAKQEEAESNLRLELDARRLTAGSRQGFKVGMRGKGDLPLKDARFEAKVIGPDGVETPVQTVRDKEDDRGLFWKTDAPGEYRVVVNGTGKDSDGPVTGEASARFLVSQDDTELARRAADHEFLKRLAASGGGKFHRGGEDELVQYLEELESLPLPGARPRANLWPDWRRSTLSGFLPLFLLAFAALAAGEWFLRRRWGLV